MKKLIFLFLFFSLGCSPLELSRLFGAGTKPFKQQGKVYSKVFDQDLSACYEQIISQLKEMETNFYRGSQKEGFIVVYNFSSVFAQSAEATEVAIFFSKLDQLKTQVEVASLNYLLAEFAASAIFDRLEGKISPNLELEGEPSLKQ
ncbi:MAG: hypothetical protein ABIE75_05005 [Candidatus Omnitrophota bacterium]